LISGTQKKTNIVARIPQIPNIQKDHCIRKEAATTFKYLVMTKEKKKWIEDPRPDVIPKIELNSYKFPEY